MSADNWAECPLCKNKTAKALRDLKEQYGKISQEEYEKLKSEFKEENSEDPDYEDTPLREDYELGVDQKGMCYVIYRGSCQTCAATWSFRRDDIFPEDSEDIEMVRKLNL